MSVGSKESFGIQSGIVVVNSAAERIVGHSSLRGRSMTACSLCALLHHLCEAVGDGESGVDEALHTAHEARLGTRVQF